MRSRAAPSVDSPITAPLGPADARRSRVTQLVLVIGFALIALASSPGITVTLDEPLHYHYGLFVLEGKTDRIDDSSMPVLALNAIPGYIASRLTDGALKDLLGRYFIARLVTIVLVAWFATVVFRWSEALYGYAAAVFSATLFVLDPNIIAQAQLVTTDAVAMGMFTLSFFTLWRFANSRTCADGLVCAITIAASQLVKYSAVALFPLGLAALLAHDWSATRRSLEARQWGILRRYVRGLAFAVTGAILATVLVLNLGFMFNRTLTPLREYSFRSSLFRSMQTRLSALGDIPIPVPYPYLEGLDWMRDTEQKADRYGNIYLLGRTSKPRGFAGYYLVAAALKVPIATQVLVLTAMAVYAADRARRGRFLQDEVFLLLPAVSLALFFNFFFNAQTGIRYYMVIFPLFYVFAGNMFAGWARLSRAAKASSIALVGSAAVSVLSYFPFFTPYFNEFVLDRRLTYKYLSDTNLEWGQSQGDLRRFLQVHPDAVLNPGGPQSGLLVVSGSDLVGILVDPERYAWLRDNFAPVDTIAYAYFVFEISDEELDAICARVEPCNSENPGPSQQE